MTINLKDCTRAGFWGESPETVGELDEWRETHRFIRMATTPYEKREIKLTRYGALKYLWGEEIAKQIKKMMPLESSILASTSTLDGTATVFDDVWDFDDVMIPHTRNSR